VFSDETRAKTKMTPLRGWAESAERSKEIVWRRIGSLRDQFSPEECENCRRNSGDGSV
jgi:hypothetical protein